jgi:hypothetical protein
VQGGRGPTGPAGSFSLTVVTATTGTLAGAQDQTRNQDATCPTATPRAVSGGASITGATAAEHVALTQVSPNGNPPTGWHGAAEQDGGGSGTWALTTYVVCSA